MIKENSKKKIYQKPQVVIEEFELNEYVAGACAENGGIVMNLTSEFQCTKQDDYIEEEFVVFGYFDDKCMVDIKATNGDEICYYTAAGTGWGYNVFTS